MTEGLFGPPEGDLSMSNSGAPENASPEPARADTPQSRPPGGLARGSAPSAGEGAPALRFEDSYARLEAIVADMERGELPLEELLQRFEEGVGLVRHCNEFLKQAQLRVEQYVEQKDGHWVLRSLD
jgi:exodeoxyribonuclease VII small subunit